MTLRKLFNSIGFCFFPNRCVCCGEVLESEEYICDYCNEMLRRVDAQKRCMLCGLEKSDKCCNGNLFHFDGCIAPFYNEDLMQNAFYSFKLSHKEYICEYFAREMTKCVKSEYSHIKLEAVTFVPSSFKSKLKRGFNQSELIAKRIAELLELPLLSHALYCNSAGKGQHSLDGKERFLNVRGMYSSKNRIKCKNILLVDDIKTTGATLDECARQLMFAGVHHVYCVTALVTEKKTKKENDKNGN